MSARKITSTNYSNEAEANKCPVSFTLGQIGGRWKPLILFHLFDGRKRYSELRKSLPHISEKILIEKLKELEKDELVLRMAKPVVPPFVEYELSKKGDSLRPVMNAMAAWGGAQMSTRPKRKAMAKPERKSVS
jgi:DNA-binding HxlR family transcriptional regulator